MNPNSCALPKNVLMRKIMEYCFALTDLGLYLDTHPSDQNALADFKSLRTEYDRYVAEYNKNYGPLNFHQVDCDNYYSWVEEKWPWEGGC